MGVSGLLGGRVPIVDEVLSFHEQEVYPTTSVERNSMEFETRTHWIHYIDLG